MIGPLIGIGGVALILSLAELLWQAEVIQRAEASRKFVHILTGTFIAFWPFLMPLWVIQILSVLLLAVVAVSKYLQVFQSIHQVRRATYGELLFPIGIGVAASFAGSSWIYTAAVLHLSLADGLAAVIGVRHLKRFQYTVLGQTKTLIGSAVFYVVSLLITTAIVVVDTSSYTVTAQAIVFWLPLVATLVENVSLYGSDNIFVPLAVIGVLNSLQTLA